jgi:hypothetical protein
MAARIRIALAQFVLLLPLGLPAAPLVDLPGSRPAVPMARPAGVPVAGSASSPVGSAARSSTPAAGSAVPLLVGVPPFAEVRLFAGMPLFAGMRLFAGAPLLAGPAPAPYRWPVDGPVWVARGFDPPPRPWLAGHRGVDLTAASGVQVRAAGTGVVLHAGQLAGRGVVSIAHEGGLRTTYEPVHARVVPGDRVFAGDLLGVLAGGHRGCPEAACLHWGLRRGEVYLDPLSLLGLGRVRLLPLDAEALMSAPTLTWPAQAQRHPVGVRESADCPRPGGVRHAGGAPAAANCSRPTRLRRSYVSESRSLELRPRLPAPGARV